MIELSVEEKMKGEVKRGMCAEKSRGKVREHHRGASVCRVLLSAGGTGGHIFPALAVAEYMRSRKICELLFVGATGRMEMELVPKAGFQIIGLPIRGFQRGFQLKNLALPIQLLLSCWKAYGVLSRFRPSVLFGTGGYASVPVLLVALLRRLPVLILEPNAWAGWANRFLGRYVRGVYVSYPGMERFFPKHKLRRTGIPLRNELRNLPPPEEARRLLGLQEDRPTILLMGGSLGALSLNRCMEACWEGLLAQGYQLVWQTGAAHYESIDQRLRHRPSGLVICPFIEQMDWAYGAASLIIARAGALTIAELLEVAKPTILVPAAQVSEDHQRYNAEALAREGAVRCVLDREASDKLFPVIDQLMRDSSACSALVTRMRSISGGACATEKIAQGLLISSNLSGVDLSGANLSHMDLSAVDLSASNLSASNLSASNLSATDLSGANLSAANLSATDLSGANLSAANLSATDLSGANLSAANLSATDLSAANLSGVDLSGADLSATDLSGANLSGVDLSAANLSGVDLSAANLSAANLSATDLSGADLSGANLSGADLSGADLSDTDLSGADLSGTCLSTERTAGKKPLDHVL